MVGAKKEKIYMEYTQEKYDFLWAQLLNIEARDKNAEKIFQVN